MVARSTHHALVSLLLLIGVGCADEHAESSPNSTNAGGAAGSPGSGGAGGSAAAGGSGALAGSTSGGGAVSSPAPSATGGGDAGASTSGEAGGAAASAGTGGSTGESNGGTTNGSAAGDGGGDVPSPPDESLLAELQASLEAAAKLDAAGLSAQHALPLKSELGYDPLTASGLSLIQASEVGLDDAELARLGQNGLVVSKRHQYPTFAYGYKTLYLHDLPVYVSADSILFALHRSFDDMLKQAELLYLVPELAALLDGMRSRLATAELPEPLRADIDSCLTLAKSLLERSLAEPVAGADAAQLQTLYDLARAAQGHGTVTWFGSARDEDFSQFKPRGHYTDDARLQGYFQAMMLLGRVDLRIVETQSDGSQIFHREQFDAAVALNDLLGADRERWVRIDEVVGWFVGERDSMSPVELGGLMAKLGVTDFASSAGLSDAVIFDEVLRGGWGAQRIASRIIVASPANRNSLPLDQSFALFGQRYTVDSHVFVNTTYDRVEGRLMPDPLDVAFGALGNDAALDHLAPSLENQSYVAGLAKTRVLIDAHEPAYWDGSLYTTWLAALRALSPSADELATQPALFSTRAGQDRILNTQLASWAELRHDTLLYAKQSYTSAGQCEFPDAYVDPYPEFYARLGRIAPRIAEIGERLAAGSDADPAPGDVLELARQRLVQAFRSWAENFQTTMAYLERMAENQRTGTPHDQELLDFVNAAVDWHVGNVCGATIYTNQTGWYLKLFFDDQKTFDFDPTIADVHTQPTNAGGGDVGRILHVGTGYARLMIATVETCDGPRAYAGLVSSFGQVIEDDWQRLTDEEWAERLTASPSEYPDPAWLSSVFAEP